ncbi:hypothetical protein L7F22_045941 [Adiantum nelumboides]|nr:hypothetical protein [Adiantum nelumboides]
MSGEDEGRQPPQHPYWTRLRQSFGQGGESSSAIEEEEEANQPTPESQYSSSSSDTEDFEQVPEEVPNLELHRGRIPERMQQRGNAPGVDAVIPGGNQVRQSNYRNWNNQGPNQRLQAQAAGWNNQRNQDRDGGNHPCTYCGISGHRQGPECPLWCKHRSERGMPIVQYNNRGNQPQQRPPAQLNAVILEEVEPEQPEDYLKTIQQESDDILRADKDCCSKGKTSKHFQCDCTECISIEEVPDDQKIPETMAVTRSGKKKEVHVQEKGEQQPMDWSAQDQIRMGVLKEINSANKQKEETRRSTLPYAGTNQKKIGWKEPVAVDQEQVKKREEAERMSEEFFEALMNAPTQISLRQILGLVPSFAHKFMQKLQNQYGIRNISDVRQEADLVQEPDWAEVQPVDVDYRVPVISVKMEQMFMPGVLIDGGSGVNVLPEETCRKLNITCWDPAPFQVKMADQRRIQPLGIVRNTVIEIGGLKFKVNFVVLQLEESSQSYPMILGRPWLRAAKVKQHWGADYVVLRQGKKKVRMKMVASKVIPPNCRPLHAETINMASELEEDEEEEFFRVNSSVIPIFEVDVQHIVEKYVADDPKVEKLKQKLGRKKLLPVGPDLEEEQKQAEIRAEKDFAEVGEAVRFRMQTKYSQKEYRLDILRVSERKLSEEVMQKRSKTIAGEKTPVKESLGSKDLAAQQDAMGNRRGRSSTKQSPTVLVDDDDDHEDMEFQPSPVATKGRTTTEHNFLEFKVEIDPLQANNARWLKRIGLLDYALLPWAHWRFTTQTGMIMAQLLEFNGLVGHGVYLSASLVAKVFDLPEGLDNTVDKASEEDMDGEFGKGEGSRNYFILKNVQNQERLQQIKWFLERVMLLVKMDYISRENYAILSWAEKERRFGWATMLYERIHSEIFSKEKKRVQRSTKVGPLITAIYMHVRNNAVLRALNPSGSHQAADRQEEDIQEGCSQPTGVRKAAQEAKQKMLDQQGGATEIYRSLLSAGYSHEECMETVGLDKSVELPKFWGETSVPTREFKTPITVSTVKKPIRLRKRKVESVAGQEPELTQQGQDTGPVQEKEQVFQDISFARVLEASSLIKEYMEQQHLNNAVLVNGNSKLKAENEELKKNLETNLLNRAEIEGLQEQIRLLTGKLQAKEEKLDFYQKQLSRRVSTAQMYKKWQEEWSAILNKEFNMLFATNARLEADNKVLLNTVTACKEVEEKIKDCTDEELVIDGWYLPAQEVDDMKAELRRQGEQIWMNFGKKMEESQLEDLQGKFNFLQEQQSEKEHKKADDSQVDEEFNVKGKRSAVEKFCFDEEPVQQTGEECESSDLHTLISKIAGDVEKPVKSLEILSDVVITSENVDDKEQDEKQDDVVKEKDELLVDVQNIKEQETVAEQQQDVVMEAVGDVQAIQDVVLYEAEKKDAD